MRLVLLPLLTLSPLTAQPVVEKGALALQPIPGAHYQFGGVAGERIAANVDGWLLSAPITNPGMLEMFRLRDRQPSPQLVPWAGEFAGKYLLSCVAALRVTDRPALRERTGLFVAELIGTQDKDGYLGPFPADRRLLGEWDLWGHYHIMRGLLEWHDLTGDRPARDAVGQAADLICRTYLDGTRRVIDAGSPEMNMAVSHVMAELHRRTGGPRYLELVRQIEKDWERSGDYLRTGLSGVPFYKTPLPRWESLHDLQTLVELWRLTGDPRYREAFASHWRTIREHDVRNSGAFSGGEQATGDPWAPTAIETCCTVAWMALSVDMLRLHGGAEAAEALELATFNAAFGSQHPGGHWWTYSTPMDGDRKSSAHEIVFQARAGTPELNCCSVNGPRTPGMLADWAIMQEGAALVVNTHAPLKFTSDGGRTALTCESRYPEDGHVSWQIQSPGKRTVRFRIPSWAEGATGSLNHQQLEVKPGTYCEVDHQWTAQDRVTFEFPLRLRTVAGQRSQAGRASVYRGPLLLAWDQRDNGYDELRIPRITPGALTAALPGNPPPPGLAGCAPWVLMEFPVAGKTVRLRDFATAGMNGTRYRSWLPAPAGPAATSGPPTLTAVPQEQAVQDPAGIIRLALPENWAAADFTVAMEVKILTFPDKRPGHLFSAWSGSGDDPLRLVVENARLHARVEGGGGGGTGGVALTAGRWYRVAAVKEGSILTLFVDGQPLVSGAAPPQLKSASRQGALGGNPLYTGAREDIQASFRAFALWPRALSADEVEDLGE